MTKSLHNKKIIVTGASGGIGERLVWHIAKKGGIPIMIARSIDKLKSQKVEIEQAFQIKAFVYQVDITKLHPYQKELDRILNEHKQIDALINNAGSGLFKTVEDTSPEETEQMFQLNVYALMNGTRLLLPHFKAAKSVCHIMNVASLAGKVATPKSSVYAATKHAVIGYTDALRMEVEDDGIYVTTINPGPVRTAFFDQADPDGSYQKSVDAYMLDPDQLAQKIVKQLFRHKRELNAPTWLAIGAKLYRLFPRTAERLFRKKLSQK